MAALAFLLRYVQKSKFHYELKNPNAVILKKEKLFHTRLSISELMFANFKKKLEDVALDFEVAEVIKGNKLEILKNLMQEQNFRIPLTSSFNKKEIEDSNIIHNQTVVGML